METTVNGTETSEKSNDNVVPEEEEETKAGNVSSTGTESEKAKESESTNEEKKKEDQAEKKVKKTLATNYQHQFHKRPLAVRSQAMTKMFYFNRNVFFFRMTLWVQLLPNITIKSLLVQKKAEKTVASFI